MSTDASISADSVRCSLKRYLTSEVSSQQVVYERCYPKSLPQKKRDSYFLTEMFNIKRLIRRQGLLESDADTTQIKEPVVPPYYTVVSPEDRTLVFESRFESGNIALAMKVVEKRITHGIVGIGQRVQPDDAERHKHSGTHTVVLLPRREHDRAASRPLQYHELRTLSSPAG